ncbi:MAG TPA: hypothetical protein P5298_13940 [Spirochaetia bacterium]|nr:hypothetical protein [Spirochaetaceae bacterium]HRW25506.1 hypothetical protein [Spirochaetia bacterium]
MLRRFFAKTGTAPTRRSALAAYAALAFSAGAALTLCGCATSPREAPAEPEPAIDSVARTDLRSVLSAAVASSLAGELDRAERAVDEALAAAMDKTTLALGLEARAWILFLSGSNEEARRALGEAASVGAPLSPGRAVLEFRLAASEDLAAARERAALAIAQGLGDRAARAIAVMLGEADLRDVTIDTPEAAAEYATYLAGYGMRPAAASPVAAASGEPPVIVVSEPESHGADEATVQVARLACRDALSRLPGLRVVDADSRRASLDELELALAGSPAGRRDVAIGDLFSADYVASGSVVASDSGWLVAYSLSSAADGHIVASDFSMAADHRAIMAAASRFAASVDGLAP